MHVVFTVVVIPFDVFLMTLEQPGQDCLCAFKNQFDKRRLFRDVKTKLYSGAISNAFDLLFFSACLGIFF